MIKVMKITSLPSNTPAEIGVGSCIKQCATQQCLLPSGVMVIFPASFNFVWAELLSKGSDAAETQSSRRKPGAMTPAEFQTIRQELGLTQAEYGRKLAGITQEAISKMERGLMRVTSELANEAMQLRDRYLKPSQPTISSQPEIAQTAATKAKNKYMQPEELITIRDSMDLTQEAMAELMNTTQPNLSHMENGFTRIRKRYADQARQLYKDYLKTTGKKASR